MDNLGNGMGTDWLADTVPADVGLSGTSTLADIERLACAIVDDAYTYERAVISDGEGAVTDWLCSRLTECQTA